jgi:hypothetical protein
MADVVNSIKGKDVIIGISTNLVTPSYKTIVCRINGGLGSTADVQTQDTTCGKAKARGGASFTITGSGIANTTPGGSEMSAEELMALMISGDSFLWKMESATPADYYRAGTGFLQSYNETANNGEDVGFDFTIEVQGDVDVTP